MASRTMRLAHKGTWIMVREGFDGGLEFQIGHGSVTVKTVKPVSKGFVAATNEARKWLIAHGGDMRSEYRRT